MDATTAPAPGTDPVGSRLLERRKELGLRQVDIAERSGVPQTSISRIESGESIPTIPTLNRLRTALEIDDAEYLRLIDGIS